MINTHKILNAVTSMQQNAQAALPVIPNNGNPAGAYNMPPQGAQTQVQGQPQAQSTYYYPWLAPSPHMEGIQNQLSARQAMLNQMLTQYSPQPIAPQAPTIPTAPQQVPMSEPLMSAVAPAQQPPVIPMQRPSAVGVERPEVLL